MCILFLFYWLFFCWNFVLPEHKLNTKYTLEDLDVVDIPSLPNDLVMDCNLPRLVANCDPLIRVISSDVSPMYDLCCRNHK